MILERDDKTWQRAPKGDALSSRGWYTFKNFVKYRKFVLEGEELKGSYRSLYGNRGKQYKLINDLDLEQQRQGYKEYKSESTLLPRGGRRFLSLTYVKVKLKRVPRTILLKLKITKL